MELMGTESRELTERSRKNLTEILTGLRKAGQVNVASTLECSESKISKMKDEQLAEFSRFLAACDLKVVSTSYRCAKPELIEAALVFATEALEQIKQDKNLIWM